MIDIAQVAFVDSERTAILYVDVPSIDAGDGSDVTNLTTTLVDDNLATVLDGDYRLVGRAAVDGELGTVEVQCAAINDEVR